MYQQQLPLDVGYQFAASAPMPPVSLTDRAAALLEAQRRLIEDYSRFGGDMTPQQRASYLELTRQFDANVKPHRTEVHRDHLDTHLSNVLALIASIPNDSGGALIRDQFLRAQANSGCNIVLDPNLNCPAVYRAYTHLQPGRGFLNQLAVQPAKCDDLLALTNSFMHEWTHAFQTLHAPVLRHVSGNPNTKIILHPEDECMVFDLTERDSFAKQAVWNFLISFVNPDMEEKSSLDILTVADVRDALERYPDHDQMIVELAIMALQREKYQEVGPGFTFQNSYHQTSLNNYAIGMKNRRHEEETGQIFVRAEPHDLWEIGNYGVGPNSLGKYGIDPIFIQCPKLTDHHQRQMATFMREYNIPPREECPTLAEAMGWNRPQIAATNNGPSLWERAQQITTNVGLGGGAIGAPMPQCG